VGPGAGVGKANGQRLFRDSGGRAAKVELRPLNAFSAGKHCKPDCGRRLKKPGKKSPRMRMQAINVNDPIQQNSLNLNLLFAR
jgi:hypothetical protein